MRQIMEAKRKSLQLQVMQAGAQVSFSEGRFRIGERGLLGVR